MARRKVISIEAVRARDLLVGDVLKDERVVLEVWKSTTPLAKWQAEATEWVKRVLAELDERWVLIRTGSWRDVNHWSADDDNPICHYDLGSNAKPGVPPREAVWRIFKANHLLQVQISREIYSAEPQMVDRHLPGDAPPIRIATDQAQHQIGDEDDSAVDVTIYRSEHDSAIVVEIDTPEVLGDDPEEFLRVNVNDSFVWGKEYERDIHLD